MCSGNNNAQTINGPGTKLISIFSRNNPVLCRFHRLFHSHGAGGLVSAHVRWPALPVGGRPPSGLAGQLRAGMGGPRQPPPDSFRAEGFVQRLISCVPPDLQPEVVPGVHVLHCVFRQYRDLSDLRRADQENSPPLCVPTRLIPVGTCTSPAS